jgi:hypothetical protein
MSKEPQSSLKLSSTAGDSVLGKARRLIPGDRAGSVLGTLGWVIPLTLLIWVYAEREQSDVRDNVTIPIQVVSTDSSRIVRLVQRDNNVTATLAGPRGKLDRFNDLLRAGDNKPAAVEIAIDNSRAAGQTHFLNTAELLSREPIFERNGLSVRMASPPQLEVRIDELVEVELEVTAPAQLSESSAVVAFDPPKVRARGPRPVLMPADGPAPVVVADLLNRPELATPGDHDLSNVRIRVLPDDGSVTLSPSLVRASVEIQQAELVETINSMPVFVMKSPGLEGRYRISLKPEFLTNVQVAGSPDVIAALRRPGSQKPRAFVDIGPDDRSRTGVPVRFDLPPGLRVVGDASTRVVDVEMVEVN